MKRDLHDIANEPHMQQRGYAANPSEYAAGPVSPQPASELEAVRDSVFSEPHITAGGSADAFADLLDRKRRETSGTPALPLSILAGFIAGPVSILGVFVSGSPTFAGLLYVIILGPIVEEFVKQLGLVYLLEKRPWLLRSPWQFPLCAAITAGVFATIETLMYINVHFRHVNPAMREELATFRWTVCTAMHIGCSVVASLGMLQVWRKYTLNRRPVNLTDANRYLLVAAIIHGAYNAIAVLNSSHFQ